MTRVVFLTPSLHHGGAERWILSLARHFREATSAGCLLLSDHYHGDMIAEARRYMPLVHCRETPGSWRHAREAREQLLSLSRDADVLVAWGIAGLRYLRQGLNLPVIDVSHASAEWPDHCKLMAASSGGADYLAGVSRTAADAYPAAMRPAVQVIYNGVEADRLAPRIGRQPLRDQWGVLPHEKLLLYLGRYSEEKRPQLLLDALESLPPQWRGLFVGHGPLEARLRQQAAERMAGRCQFVPPTSAIGDLLAAADCLLLPSRYEGMPLVLLEAWLAGLPTVVTRFAFIDELFHLHGPLSETVSLAAPAGDELAAAIERSQTGRFIATARQVVWQHYTAAAMAQRWEEYLAAVAAHWQSNRAANIAEATHPVVQRA